MQEADHSVRVFILLVHTTQEQAGLMKRAVSVRKASEQAYSRVTEVSSVWEAISLDRVAMHHVKAVTDSHVRVVISLVRVHQAISHATTTIRKAAISHVKAVTSHVREAMHLVREATDSHVRAVISHVRAATSQIKVDMDHVKAVTDSHVRVVTDSVKAAMVSVEAMVSVVATTTRMPNTT